MNRTLITIAALSVFGLFVAPSLAEDPANEPAKQPDQAPKATTETPAAETDNAKVSAYGVAYDFVMRIKPYYRDAGWDLDIDMLMKGIKDAIEEKPPQYTEEQIAAAVDKLQSAIGEHDKAIADANIAKDLKFLEENKARPEVTTTASGLQIEYLKEGTGPNPTPSDIVKVHYKGTFTNGNVFDSSMDGDQPATLMVSEFIKGFAEGLTLTKVGGKSRLVIPYELAYGEYGRGPIPPKSALVFEIELLEIVKPDTTQSDSPPSDEVVLPEDD